MIAAPLRVRFHPWVHAVPVRFPSAKQNAQLDDVASASHAAFAGPAPGADNHVLDSQRGHDYHSECKALPPLPSDPTPEKPVISPRCRECGFRTLSDGKRATDVRLYRLHGPRDFQFEIMSVSRAAGGKSIPTRRPVPQSHPPTVSPSGMRRAGQANAPFLIGLASCEPHNYRARREIPDRAGGSE